MSDEVIVLDDDDPAIPDAATCQKLVEEFAEVTGTDEACAQFYLQDRDWDLQRSVTAYFESGAHGGVVLMNDGREPQTVVNVDQQMIANVAKTISGGRLSDVPPDRFSLISWNLDGLKEKNLKKRTKAVIKILETDKPDVVFLQELIPDTYSYLEEHLPQYMFLPANDEGYFTAVLLRKFGVYYDSHEIIPFPTSTMGRNLLAVEAHIGPRKLLLLTSHLESTRDHQAERLKQLRTAFQKIAATPSDRTVLFGGDLNLRDDEVDMVGGLPPGVDDMWVACGSRAECRYTWDSLRNSNIEFTSKYRPRLRFDRLYLKASHPRAYVPKHFGLTGIQKVSGTQSFPSDHWGIVAFFEADK